LNENEARAAGEFRSIRSLQITCSVLGILLAIVFAMVIVRSITRPLGEAVEVSDDLAQGKLSTQIAVVGRDETAQLLTAMDGMVKSLVRTIGEVHDASAAISSGSQQVAATSQALSQGTSEQAASVEDTSST